MSQRSNVGPFSASGIPFHVEKVKRNTYLSYKICRPVIFWGKIFGIVPLDFLHKHYNNWTYNIWFRMFFILYQVAAKIATLCVLIFELKAIYFSLSEYSYVTMLALLITFVVPTGFVIFVNIFYLLEKNRLRCVLLSMDNVENLLKRRLKTRLFLLKNIFLQFGARLSSVVIWAALNYTANNANYLELALLLVITGHSGFITVFFVVCANLCSECFLSVNSELKEVCNSRRISLNEYLDHVHFQYEKLYQLVNSIQEAFSFPVTALIAHLTFDVCFLTYYILSSTSFDLWSIGFLLTVTVGFYSLLIICAAGDNMTMKAKLTLETLLTLQPNTLTPSEGFKIGFLTNKLSQYPVSITSAGNLFMINMGTCTTIIGTSLTYLIVLLQFNSPVIKDGLKGNQSLTNCSC